MLQAAACSMFPEYQKLWAIGRSASKPSTSPYFHEVTRQWLESWTSEQKVTLEQDRIKERFAPLSRHHRSHDQTALHAPYSGSRAPRPRVEVLLFAAINRNHSKNHFDISRQKMICSSWQQTYQMTVTNWSSQVLWTLESDGQSQREKNWTPKRDPLILQS